MTNKMLKVAIGVLMLVNALIWANLAVAITNYPPGALLQPNDVTSSHIRDGQIVNADISTSANIISQKITDGSAQGLVYISNGSRIATSSNFKISTSTPDLYLLGGRIHATSTNFGGVNYTWPSADGAANQSLSTSGTGTLSWATFTAEQNSMSITAGEDLTLGNAVIIPETISTNTKVIANTGTNAKIFGRQTSTLKYAQSFTESITINRIKLWLTKTGTPNTEIVVSLQTDSAGTPSGTTILSATTTSATITGSFVQYTLLFNSATTTSSSQTLWIVVEITAGGNDTNNLSLYGDGANTYAGGTISYWDGSVWTNQAEDMRIELLDNYTNGRAYKASSVSSASSTPFVGFSIGTYASGTAATIATGGILTGFSGLIPSTTYYLASTTGAILNLAGTVSRKVGLSVSATSLLITNNW